MKKTILKMLSVIALTALVAVQTVNATGQKRTMAGSNC